MKKIINVIMTISLIVMAGCTKQENRTIQDGTFTGSADGYNGEIEVEVTFTNGSVSKIDVIQENETKTWADDALDSVTKYIVDEQSVNVDVSTGATITSKAIMEAVRNAIEKAGGKVEDWNTDATGTYKSDEETMETDVVVVGGGISGIATVLRLRQSDIDCILVEEDEELGGTLLYGGNYSQIALGSETRMDEEVDSTGELIEDIEEYCGDSANSALLKILEEEIEETVEWQISDLGIVFEEEWLGSSSYQKGAAKKYAQSNDAIGELLSKEAEVSGAEILTNTIMTQLEKNGSDITGIQAKNTDGTIYHIQADTIVIATGASFSTDGLSIGNSSLIPDIVGATSHNEGSGIQTSLGFQISDTKAMDTYDANSDAMDSGLIIVNENGERFVNETISRNDLSDACEEDSYLVLSADAYSKWKESMIENGQLTTEEEDAIDELVYHGETLKEASALCGISYKELSKTVNLFNAEVRNDASDIFLRKDLGDEIDPEKDVYIVKLCKATYADNTGLEVNASLHWVDNGKEIDQVCVVGNAIGNAFGTRQTEGLTNAWAFISGKYVADMIAGETNA